MRGQVVQRAASGTCASRTRSENRFGKFLHRRSGRAPVLLRRIGRALALLRRDARVEADDLLAIVARLPGLSLRPAAPDVLHPRAPAGARVVELVLRVGERERVLEGVRRPAAAQVSLRRQLDVGRLLADGEKDGGKG